MLNLRYTENRVIYTLQANWNSHWIKLKKNPISDQENRRIKICEKLKEEWEKKQKGILLSFILKCLLCAKHHLSSVMVFSTHNDPTWYLWSWIICIQNFDYLVK